MIILYYRINFNPQKYVAPCLTQNDCVCYQCTFKKPPSIWGKVKNQKGNERRIPIFPHAGRGVLDRLGEVHLEVSRLSISTFTKYCSSFALAHDSCAGL